METKMKLKDLKGVRMYVFEGSKTKENHLPRAENTWSKETFQK